MLNSDQAFEIIEEAGITKNKQTFLRYVREGKIKGEIRHKRDGYRFREENILEFIETFKEEERENPMEELQRLRKENEGLKQQLKTPSSMIQAQNLKLTQKLREAENEIVSLKKQIQEIKKDQTIRIVVQ